MRLRTDCIHTSRGSDEINTHVTDITELRATATSSHNPPSYSCNTADNNARLTRDGSTTRTTSSVNKSYHGSVFGSFKEFALWIRLKLSPLESLKPSGPLTSLLFVFYSSTGLRSAHVIRCQTWRRARRSVWPCRSTTSLVGESLTSPVTHAPCHRKHIHDSASARGVTSSSFQVRALPRSPQWAVRAAAAAAAAADFVLRIPPSAFAHQLD